MQVTPGRIVLFTVPEKQPDINGARTFPAIVVAVHGGDDELVNLHVFYIKPAGKPMAAKQRANRAGAAVSS